MLTIKVPEKEFFDESTNTFKTVKGADLRLEHSLISLSRWESKWKKPFLDTNEHSKQEILDYICCMSIDKNIDPEVIENLDIKTYKEILDYIGDPHTASTVTDRSPNKPGSRNRNEVTTSELLYYYMIFYGIPFECEKWHLNRLMMLIKICGVKGNTGQNKMDMNSIFAQNKAIRARNRASRR